MTRELLELREWLLTERVTHVGMESTGIYWQPVYALLEDAFEMIVGNATRIKNVPGRKTDVKDSEWIAELVRHATKPPSCRRFRICRHAKSSVANVHVPTRADAAQRRQGVDVAAERRVRIHRDRLALRV
jgi:transposase